MGQQPRLCQCFVRQNRSGGACLACAVHGAVSRHRLSPLGRAAHRQVPPTTQPSQVFPHSRPAPRATIGSMARLYTYAEVLTPDHTQWQVHARGLGCGHEPGLVLQEVLDRNGGRYQTTMPMSEDIREQARICAQVSGDEEIAQIASLSEVTVSLEHLRDLDLSTRIVCGYGLGNFTDAECSRLPRDEGPVDSATIIEGPFDPANSRRRIFRKSGDG
jgi:hypothetical protein